MRKISSAEAKQIDDFAIESGILPAYVLEKDLHVFAALEILANMPVSEYFRLVFCGGTCLSKSYGILDRMSEDVDFKLVPTDAARALTGSARRSQLKVFRKLVFDALSSGGFTGEGAIIEKALDEGAYSSFSVTYESAFEKTESLRSHLLIELSYTELFDDAKKMDAGRLIDKLIGAAAPQESLKIECVSLAEALAEKLVAFPRRLGKQMSDRLPAKSPEEAGYDDAALTADAGWDVSLVRHLYDVITLLDAQPQLISSREDFTDLVLDIIAKDSRDFKSSHADYQNDPSGALLSAMSFAVGSKQLQAQYDKFVIDMVYGKGAPSYAKSVSFFESTLRAILEPPILEAVPMKSDVGSPSTPKPF
ncbi:MAG: nucleotidyl transferase AbiEii/AbiGii toxin family protein [Aeromicrobium sp.]|nr:nucleotidyl transferase AbiEii/AbiGii toxin family protein [Burkholderiales bacterium]